MTWFWRRVCAIAMEQVTPPTNRVGYEALTAMWLVGLGLWWLAPWPTFASAVYSVLLTIAPEWAWGLLMALVGGVQAASIIIDDGMRKRFRQRASYASFTLLLFLSVALIVGNWRGTSTIVFPMATLLAALPAIRIRMDA